MEGDGADLAQACSARTQEEYCSSLRQRQKSAWSSNAHPTPQSEPSGSHAQSGNTALVPSGSAPGVAATQPAAAARPTAASLGVCVCVSGPVLQALSGRTEKLLKTLSPSQVLTVQASALRLWEKLGAPGCLAATPEDAALALVWVAADMVGCGLNGRNLVRTAGGDPSQISGVRPAMIAALGPQADGPRMYSRCPFFTDVYTHVYPYMYCIYIYIVVG